jgi:hypothetical protein
MPRRRARTAMNAVAVGLGMGLLVGSMRVWGAAEWQFASADAQTTLVELYTSEGCSSCPPAEAALSRLKDNPGLWKSFVPVAWHVDYWNYLGWKDRFSSARYTERQRGYAAKWGSDSVYTPAFVVNGQEWHLGIGSVAFATAGSRDAGALAAKTDDGQRFTITYEPPFDDGSEWEVHVALLGCGILSKIGAGENRGRDLRHDFVVLEEQAEPMKVEKNMARVEVVLQSAPVADVSQKAVAIWVSRRGQLAPAQATGGWLALK